MSLYTSKQRKTTFFALILIMGVFLVFSMKGIFTAILGAVVLYTLFKPMYIWLTCRWKLGKSISSLIVIGITFLLIVLPLMLLTYMLVSKIQQFQKDPSEITRIIERINTYSGTNFDKPALVQNGIENLSTWALGSFTSVVSGVFQTFITLTVLYFLLYFMFCSHEEFEHTLMKYLPFPEESSLRFGSELKNITYSNILGQGLIAISQGIIVGVGFLIFHIPDPLFWGVISIFVCFLPVVGAPVIIVPAGVAELAYGHTLAGVGIMVWGLTLVTVIDNFLRLFISRKMAKTHALITIIGVVIGVPIFGLLGLVIGPLLLSYFILMVTMYETQYTHPEEAEDTAMNCKTGKSA
ncbi:MAG TPA: AI-2E family transporter [Bacteroidia bacterium]|jgi:predicted PurR-regulated permease PerM|nr:AI-2E family transporter [Bacteroidia bacterium]